MLEQLTGSRMCVWIPSFVGDIRGFMHISLLNLMRQANVANTGGGCTIFAHSGTWFVKFFANSIPINLALEVCFVLAPTGFSQSFLYANSNPFWHAAPHVKWRPCRLKLFNITENCPPLITFAYHGPLNGIYWVKTRYVYRIWVLTIWDYSLNLTNPDLSAISCKYGPAGNESSAMLSRHALFDGLQVGNCYKLSCLALNRRLWKHNNRRTHYFAIWSATKRDGAIGVDSPNSV